MNAKASLSIRSRLVGAANVALPALYAARLLDRPELDAEAICADAVVQTGLSDFGGDWFRGPLGVLVEALREEAQLNPLGLFAAEGQLRKVVKDRLRAEAILGANPDIARRSLARPVFVVGPMRSGTTRLHRLLAADRRFAHMRAFETVDPVPGADFQPGDKDNRWITSRLALGAVHLFNPSTAHIHPTGPFEPEEELGLLVRSIWGMKHEAQWHVPSYGRWSEGQDATPAYAYMARLLRLIGWARGDDDTRPWVLKTPQHMLDLPALLKVFPDARFVFTHREPRSVVGSSCSLVWNQMIIHSDRVDAQVIGREWLRKTELQIERMRKARLRIPSEQRIDVRYEDMERDWQAVMRDVYAFLDMDIGPALRPMASYLAGAEPERARHPHRYSLDAFGLDSETVGEKFRSYTEAFELGEPHRKLATREGAIAFPEPVPVRPAAAAAPAVGGWSTVARARVMAGRR